MFYCFSNNVQAIGFLKELQIFQESQHLFVDPFKHRHRDPYDSERLEKYKMLLPDEA